MSEANRTFDLFELDQVILELEERENLSRRTQWWVNYVWRPFFEKATIPPATHPVSRSE